jgi:intein/homing endonuclease
VRVQWDPERGMNFEGLGHRSIQVGLSGQAVEEGLLGGWIVKIEDFTELAKRIGELVKEGKVEEARQFLPEEKIYEFLDEEARVACGADTT